MWHNYCDLFILLKHLYAETNKPFPPTPPLVNPFSHNLNDHTHETLLF